MEINELEKRLKNGEFWGFRKPTGSEEYLGFVIVQRLPVAPVTPFDPEEEPENYARWRERAEAIHKQPYLVLIMEIKRSAHEDRNYYADDDDYRERHSHRFATLKEVEVFLAELGFDLKDIRPGREIEIP